MVNRARREIEPQVAASPGKGNIGLDILNRQVLSPPRISRAERT
jgi:hypothetical protein